MKLLIMQYPPIPFYVLSLIPSIILITLLSKTFASLSVWETKFHIYTKKRAKFYCFMFYLLRLWTAKWKTEDSGRNYSSHSPR